ncbi:MAG: NADH-quinone oxidoreductase subunit K [Chromatiales bacterium]|nr:NADH-quinone oxidoreductase subunit K [Chromatiales bacterium]
MTISVATLALGTGLLLMLIGLWGLLAQRNLIRLILGFSLLDTGIHIVMVSIGYVTGGTAPIIDAAVDPAQAVHTVVDPIPSALVLTAIVIGLGITAVMLSFAIRIHDRKKTLSIEDCTESKG